MSDRIHSLTVVLESDVREEDAKQLMSAIRLMRGVISVDPNVADLTLHTAEMRARTDIGEKLWEVLRPKLRP